MEKKSNNFRIYIIFIILIIGLIMAFIYKPKSWQNLGNTYSLKESSIINSDPIKLQFRNAFKYDKYTPDKKTTFLQKRLEKEEDDKKTIFWKQKK